MRPGGGPVPNFFMPMVQQGQQGQRPGGRRTGAVQQSQQTVPLMQQQVVGVVFHLISIWSTSMLFCKLRIFDGFYE